MSDKVERWAKVKATLARRSGFCERRELHDFLGKTFSEARAIKEWEHMIRSTRGVRKANPDAPLPEVKKADKISAGRNAIAGNWLRLKVKSGALLDEKSKVEGEDVRTYRLGKDKAEKPKAKPAKTPKGKKAKAKKAKRVSAKGPRSKAKEPEAEQAAA